MSSEIWKIGQETSAEDYYKNIREKGINGCIFQRSETIAVSQLTNVCQAMIDAYNDIVEDQNEYQLEIDEIMKRAENTANDIQERIEKLLAEINELKQKEENGTLTEEEKGQLLVKLGQLRDLEDLAAVNNKTENDKVNEKNDELKFENRSKEKIATEYGETTVEKGTPLANTEVKGGFFRKLFGSTGKHKKEVGEKAVQVGNNLLSKVSESVQIQNEIDIKINKQYI